MNIRHGKGIKLIGSSAPHQTKKIKIITYKMNLTTVDFQILECARNDCI